MINRFHRHIAIICHADDSIGARRYTALVIKVLRVIIDGYENMLFFIIGFYFVQYFCSSQIIIVPFKLYVYDVDAYTYILYWKSIEVSHRHSSCCNGTCLIYFYPHKYYNFTLVFSVNCGRFIHINITT